MDVSPQAFLDLEQCEHASLFEGIDEVWAVLPRIREYLAQRFRDFDPDQVRQQGVVHERAVVGPDVFVASGAVVEANAVIKGPAWIGGGTTVRSGAYLRENVIVGDDCTLGNSSEFKNCLLFNRCEVPHFNYVGDTVLGYRAHLGAGVICSNVRLDRATVRVQAEGLSRIDTGLRKFGAIVGDRTEVGCNAVLNPGSLLGRDCILFPGCAWSGVLPDNSIARVRTETQLAERRSKEA